jgi:polyisoprenoid-binding protein YceI
MQNPCQTHNDQASINVSSLSTGNPKRDSHLLTADFLNTTEYPRIEFSSSNVSETAPGAWTVSGDLTLHGTTRPVVLDATLVGSAPRFRIRTALNRRDFGVTKAPTDRFGLDPKRDG